MLQAEACGDDLFAESGEIVLVGASYLPGEAMKPEAFEKARDLPTGLVAKVSPKGLVLPSADVELASRKRFKQHLVILIEEVEPEIRPVVLVNGFADAVEFVGPHTGGIDSGQELQVAAVGSQQQFL